VLIVLDSGPLGLLSNPSRAGRAPAARAWASTRLHRGDRFVVPEIADYEVRRELVRAGRTPAIARLDELCAAFGYLALTTAAMRTAAELWADARNEGRPTAADAALDGDVILAAQTRNLSEGVRERTVVVTTNTKHLERYVEAHVWESL
jgi:predicted nucleic acid-binding protein